MRTGNFGLALLLLLLSLSLLWARGGISSISALIRFCLKPSIPVTKVANPLSWGSYLFGYNLSLAIISAVFVAFPIRKYLGAESIAVGSIASLLIAPVVEELTYRLPLRYSEINLTISALLITLFTARGLLVKFGLFGLATATERWLWSAAFAVLVAYVVFVLLRTETVKRLASRIWLDHFRSVVYVSCFAFALAHIVFNYRFPTFTGETLLLAPLLVLPQIIGGFILAFARMHLGMIWCVVLHAANNFVGLWLFPITPRR
jgi:hypothetical protein